MPVRAVSVRCRPHAGARYWLALGATIVASQHAWVRETSTNVRDLRKPTHGSKIKRSNLPATYARPCTQCKQRAMARK
jgi:hypothetical protein